jgi:hypothetical protein
VPGSSLRTRPRGAAILAAAALLPIAAADEARGQALPLRDGLVHQGVASCAGAPCHGASQPGKQAVLQTEHANWLSRDAHARAYQVLFDARSERIARNLGLAEPAHRARVCLGCHADAVPEGLAGERFSIEDGVGCEACHGGSERWLAPHAAGNTHARNVELGMYPTDDPRARAELCLSCHFGDQERFVSHRLMGAGHPRQSFELHVFSEIQPAHYAVDEDYLRRGKLAVPGAQAWAIGQAVAVRKILDGLLDPARARDGIWPEFVFFDCHACHHPLSEGRWRPRPGVGLGPGVARINDASFLMLRHALLAVDPAGAEALRGELRAFHASVSGGGGDAARAAAALRARAVSAVAKLAAWRVDAESVRAIARSLVDEGLSGEYLDYAAAEQATLALQVLADSLVTLKALTPGGAASCERITDRLLDLTRNPERYRPEELRAELGRMRDVLGRASG